MNRIFRNILYFVAIAGTIVCAGCATAINGANENIKIESIPPGANVSIDDINRGETPLEIELARGKLHRICFKKDGYVEATVLTTNTLNGWIFGNILFGGLIGIAVDISSGAAKNIEPNPVIGTLIPVSTSRPVEKNKRGIVDGGEKSGGVPIPKWLIPGTDFQKPARPGNNKKSIDH